MTTLSIVIVSWNTRDLLAACLASIQRHPPVCAFEVWVVDNASADESAAMIREQFVDAHVIENQQNVGFARANNQAIRASTGEFVLLLNSDTEVQPSALSNLVSFMQQHPDAGICGAQLINLDNTLQKSVQSFPTLISELVVASGLGSHPIPTAYTSPRRVDAVVGAALLARRAAIDRVGLLDEAYFMYTEEVDWCYRFVQAGWNVFVVPDARITHVNGGSSKPIAIDRVLWLSKGRIRFLSQHRPAWQVLACTLGLRTLGVLKAVTWFCIGLARPASRNRAFLKSAANWRLARWR